MTKFVDGTGRTLEIEMKTWDGDHYTPDFAHDFFSVGSLPHDEENDAFVVDDVAYIFEQGRDWANLRGGYREDEEPEGIERVFNATFAISKEKQLEVLRGARYTKYEAEKYLANGQVTVWVKEEYDDQRERFPEDFEGDEIEEVHYAECEDYTIVTNWV